MLRYFALTAVMGGIALAAPAGLLSEYSLLDASMVQWRLPERLNEISGLALTADERLLAVADEQAVVYELDIMAGRLKKAFAMGDPVLRGDFEGIAVVGTMIYLVTSDGDLVMGGEGRDGQQVVAKTVSTGLGKFCEIEGLAADIAGQRLLIACKESRPRERHSDLPIFAWSLTGESLLEEQTIRLPMAEIRARLDTNRFNPSGIAHDPASGNLLVVAARQHAVVEVTAGGSLVNARRLPLAERHRQPEGIERMRDGRLLIADEGGNHKGRLAIYSADRPARQVAP